MTELYETVFVYCFSNQWTVAGDNDKCRFAYTMDQSNVKQVSVKFNHFDKRPKVLFSALVVIK